MTTDAHSDHDVLAALNTDYINSVQRCDVKRFDEILAPAHGSPHAGAAAALAFDDLVAFLEQSLAFAVLALRPLLDVGAFDVVHEPVQSMMRGARRPGICLAGVRRTLHALASPRRRH